MDEYASGSMTATLDELPEQRPCTRCDGHQHLLASGQGMGKYRCDTCQMAVGFDLDARPVEFLLHRGMPSRYTKNVFGETLLGSERRLTAAAGGR